MHNDPISVVTAVGSVTLDALVDPVRVVGHVAPGDDLVAVTAATMPDVLVTHTSIGREPLTSACRRLRGFVPAVRILTLASSDDDDAYAALAAGAHAVIGDDLDGTALSDAVSRVADRESMLLPEVAARLRAEIDALTSDYDDPLQPPPSLSSTERELLYRITAEAGIDKIARERGVTARLVNVHVGYVVAKLHRYLVDWALTQPSSNE